MVVPERILNDLPGLIPEMIEQQGSNMPEFYLTDRPSLERDSDMEFFIASGPGGQHRIKVETGVRLIHRPSGITHRHFFGKTRRGIPFLNFSSPI